MTCETFRSVAKALVILNRFSLFLKVLVFGKHVIILISVQSLFIINCTPFLFKVGMKSRFVI